MGVEKTCCFNGAVVCEGGVAVGVRRSGKNYLIGLIEVENCQSTLFL